MAALANAPTGGGSPSAVATAVWQDLLASSDFSTAGSVGLYLKGLNAPYAASAVSATGFTLGTTDPFFGLSKNLAGYQFLGLGATTNGTQDALITSSSGNVVTVNNGSWPGGTPTGTLLYGLQAPVLGSVGSVAGNVGGNLAGSVAGSVASVANLTGMAFDSGTVLGSPAPTATTFSSSSGTLTATVSGAYVGSLVIFQVTASLGKVHRIVTGHTVTGGVHAFTVTTTTQTTPTIGPVANDTFILG